MTTSYKRVAVVTVGLMGVGALVGALCAVAILAILTLKEGDTPFFGRGTATVLGIVATFGAVVGAVGAPLLAWGVLQRVPLGRAIAFTAAGTILGSVFGDWWMNLSPSRVGIPGMILGAVAGFVIGGVVVRFATPAKTTQHEPVV